MYKLQTHCRACTFGPPVFAPGTKSGSSSDGLVPVFSLGTQPLANDFCLPEDERSGFAPLEVLLCPRCGLAQLSAVVNPEILYKHNYPYITSPSATMREHFESIWYDCMKMATGRTVLEIGSNDGLFLDYCLKSGAEAVVGIEPAENLAEIARKRGVATICEFFGASAAALALQFMPEVGIIFARHVFCHVSDWQAFMANLQLVAGKHTLICIEVPYVMDQIKAGSFDQIYHEHLSYLSIRAMKALLDGGPFHLRKILHYPIHGGAIMLLIERREAGNDVDPSVLEYLEREDVGPGTWEFFGDRAREMIGDLRNLVEALAMNGKRVVGYGASAKSTVWINAMGLTRKQIAGVYDSTPQKWYRSIPGTDIPVLNEGSFYADAPDYAVLFAWNFTAECIAKQHKWMEGGGKWIVPVPSLRVIGIDGETSGV